MLSNSSVKSSHNLCQSSMVKSLVCSGAGLTSMRMTEFLTRLDFSSVSRIESHIPVASRPGGSRLSPTWKMRSGCFLFLDSPVMYLMSFIPWEMDFAFPIMARPPCLHRSLSRRAGGWKTVPCRSRP